MLFEGLTKKPPSLVDLCVKKAIENVKYIGYVGGVDFHLLERILQHSTLEQLMHIENSTQDTDLSPVTNKLWKRFFEKQFREEEAMEESECNEVKSKWRDPDEANWLAMQVKEKEADRLIQRFKIKNASDNLANVKSNIMKKAKLDLLKSQEVKNRTSITIQNSFSISAPMRPGLSANAPSTSRSIPCGGRDLTAIKSAIKRKKIQNRLSISALKRTG